MHSNVAVVPVKFFDSKPKFDFSQIFQEIMVIRKLPRTPIISYNLYTTRARIVEILQHQPDAYFRCDLGLLFLDQRKCLNFAVPLDSAQKIVFDQNKTTHFAYSADAYWLDSSFPRSSWPTSELDNLLKNEYKSLKSRLSYRSDPTETWSTLIIKIAFEEFTKARTLRRKEIAALEKSDPEFKKLQENMWSCEKTNASLDVVQRLSKLHSIIGDIITGVQKGSVSSTTITQYSSLVSDMGRDKRDIVGPVRKYFIKKGK